MPAEREEKTAWDMEGIGTGGRKEWLTEPHDVNLHSRDCTVTFSYRSFVNSSLNLKTAQVYR